MNPMRRKGQVERIRPLVDELEQAREGHPLGCRCEDCELWRLAVHFHARLRSAWMRSMYGGTSRPGQATAPAVEGEGG